MALPLISKSNTLKAEWVILLCLMAATFMWYYARYEQARWANVPPPPRQDMAASGYLGDTQFAYRATGLILQNMGDYAGRFEKLTDYNYEYLKNWFFLMDHLDPVSDYMPNVAGFYFGAVKDPARQRLVVEYLEKMGEREGPNKWRWLAQAVASARFDIKDYDLALRLANKLAAMYKPGMPGWVLQMPAFVMTMQGDKEGASSVILEILKSSAETMDPNEVNFMREYICDRLWEGTQDDTNPLCQGIPGYDLTKKRRLSTPKTVPSNETPE